MASLTPYSHFRLKEDSNGRFKVEFRILGKRFRFSDGRPINIDIQPNIHPKEHRQAAAIELAQAYKQAMQSGWTPLTKIEATRPALELIRTYLPPFHLSAKYRQELADTRERMEAYLANTVDDNCLIEAITTPYWNRYLETNSSSPSTFNHERQRVQAILNGLMPAGTVNPIIGIKQKRIKQVLHRPIHNLSETLEDILAFNPNLHLCCLLTYGCLLRPHREIRELKWKDFESDLTHIALAGTRNKSGRNRIVPIPRYIQPFLKPTEPHLNIFSGEPTAYNGDYFKSLWTRYKTQSAFIDDDQTLYSFRHTGAIEIFKRTGSLQLLQQAMGHASLAVTLGYLRNLDVPVLKEEMMPALQ
jgi:integrase